MLTSDTSGSSVHIYGKYLWWCQTMHATCYKHFEHRQLSAHFWRNTIACHVRVCTSIFDSISLCSKIFVTNLRLYVGSVLSMHALGVNFHTCIHLYALLRIVARKNYKVVKAFLLDKVQSKPPWWFYTKFWKPFSFAKSWKQGFFSLSDICKRSQGHQDR